MSVKLTLSIWVTGGGLLLDVVFSRNDSMPSGFISNSLLSNCLEHIVFNTFQFHRIAHSLLLVFDTLVVWSSIGWSIISSRSKRWRAPSSSFSFSGRYQNRVQQFSYNEQRASDGHHLHDLLRDALWFKHHTKGERKLVVNTFSISFPDERPSNRAAFNL